MDRVRTDILHIGFLCEICEETVDGERQPFTVFECSARGILRRVVDVFDLADIRSGKLHQVHGTGGSRKVFQLMAIFTPPTLVEVAGWSTIVCVSCQFPSAVVLVTVTVLPLCVSVEGFQVSLS